MTAADNLLEHIFVCHFIDLFCWTDRDASAVGCLRPLS